MEWRGDVCSSGGPKGSPTPVPAHVRGRARRRGNDWFERPYSIRNPRIANAAAATAITKRTQSGAGIE